VKGKPDILKNVIATVDTGAERVAITFVGQDKRSTFEPDRVAIEKADGHWSRHATIRRPRSRAAAEHSVG